jgi:hypothetical protein
MFLQGSFIIAPTVSFPSPPRLTSGATMIIAELPCFYFWPRYAALMLLQLRERLEWYLVCR